MSSNGDPFHPETADPPSPADRDPHGQPAPDLDPQSPSGLDPAASADSSGQGELACPHCSQPIEVVRGDAACEIACPACGGAFIVPSIDGEGLLDDPDRVAELRAREREAELSGVRMRQISASRRAAIRSQTYCVCGAVLAGVCAIHLAIQAILQVRKVGWQEKPITFLAIAGLCAIAAQWCISRARHWNRESHVTGLEEPQGPPDFSTLSDGSQQIRNLEDVK